MHDLTENNPFELLIETGAIEGKYTSTGRFLSYEANLYHKGLGEHKRISANEHDTLLDKIKDQTDVWNTKWQKKLRQERSKELTKEASLRIQEIEKILEHALNTNNAISWETLKHNKEFKVSPQPLEERFNYIRYNKINGYPEEVMFKTRVSRPDERQFFTKIGFLQKLMGQKQRIITEQKKAFDLAIAVNEAENEKIQKNNFQRQMELKELQRQWEEKKVKFEKNQKENNDGIDRIKNLYNQKDTDAIKEYCGIILRNSKYPENFPKEFDLQYNNINGILLVDYQLPNIDDIPSLNHARYIKSRDEIEKKHLSQISHTKLYDLAIYQIALRTLHELFEADKIDAFTSVVFNGFVVFTNPATGHKETCCIISVQTQKNEFKKISLPGIIARQSYKECFKSLKGVGCAELSTMTAVKPILEMDKSDRRFINHYEVAHNLNEKFNIAAMDWEDFEHLIRELFAKEFASNGGEVKVTQASSDGGVDAIAYDPDPIRGGKIVIQAKRYTNTVGVAAVRDLYGTVMNEGATKGVLVTTSDYGADSYAFAKDKPLTLLNGSNLLHLLEKHGHQAKIDIPEAKHILKQRSSP